MGGRCGGKLVMLLSTPFPHLLRLRLRLRLRPPPQLRLGRLPTTLHHHLPFTTSTLLPLSTTTSTGALFHTQAAHATTISDNHHQQQPQPLSALSHPWPWPEWTSFLQLLSSRGYFDRSGVEGDAFAPTSGALSPQFMREATSCCLFARDRPDFLRSLSRKDIEVVVENGTASLFINAMDSANRLRSFLAGNDFDVLEAEKVGTLDLMRYLLTYAANHLLASHEENFKNKDMLELSVRNLINGLVGLFRSSEGFIFSESFPMQPHEVHVQSPGSFRQGIEMKLGDWICPKCNFMNFARNMKCLDCKVDRPPRNLTGREWECPQCNFLNYGRNTVCLRCDCQRPGDSHSGPAAYSNSGFTKGSDTTLPLTGNISNQAEIERRLAANDEKAERWFSKMSQMDNVSDMNSAIADEDFPEIMPLRKGVNRFVVSTRKTPLERRLANAQYRKNLGNGGASVADGPQSPTTSSSSSITESLDRILGRVTQASEKDKSSLPDVNAYFTKENSSGRGKVNTSVFDQNVGNQRRDDGYVPFVPFPKDMFSQNQSKVSNIEEKPNITEHFTAPKSIEPGNYGKMFLTENSEKTTGKKSVEQEDKVERWQENFSQMNDVSDLSSTVPDDDFPEIIPMRKGENRFMVGKKKDRTLTSPQYKRRLAMEQANSSNYVPFVPFPPDYFAKKDKQPEAGDTASSKSQSSNISESEPLIQSLTPQKTEDNKNVGPNWGVSHDNSVNYKKEEMNQHQEAGHVLKFGGDTGVSSVRGSFPAIQHSNDQMSSQPSGNSLQYGENSSDKRGFTGKSLEGSAVTEPDPLDMSEEAKAARWFRRVQQINDISELANIPDEDFPSIMPMRKGVNRFVVSKRKTPLERRLTSPKYRRDLPIFSSEPKQMPPPDSEGSN